MFLLLLFAAALGLAAQPASPITASERAETFVKGTFGPASLLAAGPVSACFNTSINSPREWGRSGEGFGRRYGMRLVNNSVTNAVEVTTGALWDEDPRYHPLGKGHVGARIGYALRHVFVTRYGDGGEHFGAARLIGITAGSFGQNLWMPDSVSTARDGAIRVGTGYAGRAASNLFREFGPDIFRIFKRKK